MCLALIVGGIIAAGGVWVINSGHPVIGAALIIVALYAFLAIASNSGGSSDGGSSNQTGIY